MRASYPTYKSTSIPWLPEMPEHWEQRKNKYLFRRSKSLVGKDFEKYPVLSLTMNGVIRRDLDNPMGKMPATFADYQLIKENTLLFCLFDYDVTPRTVGMVNEKGIVSPAYTSMYPVEKIDLKYYYYWFLMLDERKMLLTHVTNLRNSVSYETFAGLFSPLPPLPEQTAISNYLDAKSEQINRFIAKKEKLIALLKEQKQAVINELLEDKEGKWERKKLKYCVTKVGSGITPSGGATVYKDSGIPLLRSQNIHNDRLELDDVAFITQDVHDSMSGSKVLPGDVLLNITGGSLGRCFYATGELGEANVNQHVSIIRPHPKKIKTEFLQLLLISEIGRKQIWREQTGSGREGLNGGAIKNFVFPIPSIQSQVDVVDNIRKETNSTDIAISRIEKEIEKVKELKQSLIAEVVTGRIKVA